MLAEHQLADRVIPVPVRSCTRLYKIEMVECVCAHDGGCGELTECTVDEVDSKLEPVIFFFAVSCKMVMFFLFSAFYVGAASASHRAGHLG